MIRVYLLVTFEDDPQTQREVGLPRSKSVPKLPTTALDYPRLLMRNQKSPSNLAGFEKSLSQKTFPVRIRMLITVFGITEAVKRGGGLGPMQNVSIAEVL